MARTWFITGTSSGFGRLLTEQLLARGDRVVATLRRPQVLSRLRRDYRGRLWAARLDVTDAAQVRQVVTAAFAALGTIDVIVSNAGFGLSASVEEASEEQIRRVIDTNLFGSIHVIRAALPHLRAQRHGHILQMSSEGGQAAFPNFGYYHASKWAIEGFCEAVAQEILPFGIGLTIVEPGATRTGFQAALVNAPAMPEYDRTPAGDMRRAAENGSYQPVNDPAKVVRAIIDLVDGGDVPLRLLLGSDAYRHVRASLIARLSEYDMYRDITMSVARDDLTTPRAG